MKINSNIIISFFFLTILACKKKEIIDPYKDLNATEYFSISTNLKNLKNIERFKVNDSIFKIKGQFEAYEITGNINNNQIRLGWWVARNAVTRDIKAKLEYIFIDNKEFVNQYILFKNGKIDTAKSKFYSFSKKNDSIKYKFYMPVEPDEIRSDGNLNYRYSYQGKEKRHLESKAYKNNNIFTNVIFIPKTSHSSNLIIRGAFWKMMQLKNGSIAKNDIYVLDTLK
ncbi:hypothetical protein [Chryseobacterium polytrichastri]|uniref:Uncharacterized protein n=1 Tax=Chryseobacterium polytrichastri TaxID=1302687 RepID=A0A1M6TAE4_9FLAO|nr:hypothetical protein [Chryseobacterium polytrichastri]SHK53931.1 hypothetical protein SAMN05444267_100532 [Chryseobacterium polytrichastri]